MNGAMIVILIVTTFTLMAVRSEDTNSVFDPCMDTKIQRFDGFTFGLAIANEESFFVDEIQLSPCDSRLSLSSKGAKLAVFRPKVDEISLLTFDSTAFDPISAGGYMVAFAGRKYAARSTPIMVAENGVIGTSFTLVLEFQDGILQNLYWKRFGCDSCPDGSTCVAGESCGVPASECRNNGGKMDCDMRIQVAFSGSDKQLEPLNSWYEVSNLRRYSLYGLYSGVSQSIL